MPEGLSTARSQRSQLASVIENPNLSCNKRKDRGAGLEDLIHVEESSGGTPAKANSPLSPAEIRGRKVVKFLYITFYSIITDTQFYAKGAISKKFHHH